MASHHHMVANRVNNLGSVLQDLGDLPGARSAYVRALSIFTRVLGPDHLNTRTVAANLAALDADQTRQVQAPRLTWRKRLARFFNNRG